MHIIMKVLTHIEILINFTDTKLTILEQKNKKGKGAHFSS